MLNIYDRTRDCLNIQDASKLDVLLSFWSYYNIFLSLLIRDELILTVKHPDINIGTVELKLKLR